MEYASLTSALNVRPANVMFVHGLEQIWEANSLIEHLQRRNYSIAADNLIQIQSRWRCLGFASE
jgi:hypothetical protein